MEEAKSYDNGIVIILEQIALTFKTLLKQLQSTSKELSKA
jgi:hypothetical protein